jgi:hypothetical protein
LARSIPQRGWLKGVDASTPKESQRKATLPRGSNLLLTKRGALVTCDGSLIISQLNGALQPGTGPWTEITLFQPVNVNRYYIGIKKDYTAHLTVPNINAPTDAGAGGTLLAGTYIYAITALDGAGGETFSSGPGTITILINHKITVTWSTVANAISYNVYRTPVNGVVAAARLLVNVTATTFTDDGSLSSGGPFIPGANTTQQCLFYKIPVTTYDAANIIATFPADPIVPVDGTGGGTGGGGGGSGGGGGGSAGAPPTPLGGNMGNLSPIPQIIQFVNFGILALGNGFAPQLFTDPSAVTAITNTFVAAYPDWTTGVSFQAGDIIMPTAGNAGNFVFKAVQSGVAGAAHPTWPQTANQQVQETNQKLIWVNTGATNTVPAPRGAAHAIVYAGSLWVANTNPTTTSDNFDGPNCLKMSDLNNPKSWNPLNTAFLGKDDGDQITGMNAFSIAADGISPTGSLVVFKNFKTYQIVGVFGASNFAIQEAQTDLGCIAPRSITFLPGFGIARLTHLGIAIFDGVRDKIISEEIRPYLFGGTPDIASLDWNFAYFSKGSQAASPPMYMLATPVSLNNLSFSTAITFAFGAGVSTWAVPTNIFFRVSRFTVVSGQVAETDLSLEKTSAPATNNTVVTVQSTGGLDPLAVKFRVYFGVLPNAYTSYAEITPAAMAAGVTLTGPASFPTAGTLMAGIGGLTRVFCYDLVLKAWAIIDLPFSISVLKQVRAVGTIPITVAGDFNDGAVRRLQSGDPDFDGSAINWQMRSPEVFGKTTNERLYYRRLNVRGTTTQAALTLNATINNNGSDGTTLPFRVYQMGSASGVFDFLAQIDLSFAGVTSHVTLSGSGQVEIDSLDWEVVPMSTGVPIALG